jgi:hypothetical protein
MAQKSSFFFQLHRVWRQPLWRVLLFSEAWLWLALARVLLRVLPSRELPKLLGVPFRTLLPGIMNSCVAEFRQNVRWAIRMAVAFLPGETVCFPRGIAAHAMCRLRGIPTTLVYGAALTEDGKLKTHVWIQDGGDGVIGHALAGEYRVVAEFPVR